MALLARIPSSPATPIQSRTPNSFFPRQIFTINCSSNAQKASPFTEKHSIESQLQPSCSCLLPSDGEFVRDYDIALQLPNLKKLLEVLIEKRKNENGCERMGLGNVFLVGTGPGDTELLTIKALRVIETAELLLYDRLVSNDVLNLVGPNAKLLYVGKTAGYNSRTQVIISRVLLDEILAVAIVVIITLFCFHTHTSRSDFVQIICVICGIIIEEKAKDRLIYSFHKLAVSSCSKCHGNGKIITDRCRGCNGRGRVQPNRTIEVAVPLEFTRELECRSEERETLIE